LLSERQFDCRTGRCRLIIQRFLRKTFSCSEWPSARTLYWRWQEKCKKKLFHEVEFRGCINFTHKASTSGLNAIVDRGDAKNIKRGTKILQVGTKPVSRLPYEKINRMIAEKIASNEPFKIIFLKSCYEVEFTGGIEFTYEAGTSGLGAIVDGGNIKSGTKILQVGVEPVSALAYEEIRRMIAEKIASKEPFNIIFENVSASGRRLMSRLVRLEKTFGSGRRRQCRTSSSPTGLS